MKKFLLYVLLPSIVLGMVYSMGKSAGERSRPIDPSQFPVTQVDTSQAAAPTSQVPAMIAAPSRQGNALVMPQRADTTSVPLAKPQTLPTMQRQSQQLLQAVPVERYQVRQIPQVIETQDNVMPQSYTAQPATNYPYPAPGTSVYERVPQSRPSAMGLVPLAPLQPIPDSRVSPAPMNSVSAPQVQSAAQVYQSRAASVDCDCGKTH